MPDAVVTATRINSGAGALVRLLDLVGFDGLLLVFAFTTYLSPPRREIDHVGLIGRVQDRLD